jgi:hypothetical protein
MKRILIVCLQFVAAMSFCGCVVQSLHPFFTEEAVIKSPVENGEWVMLDKDGKPEAAKPWVFEDDEILTYDEDGGSGVVKVVYFKIEDTVFMDAIADEPSEGTSDWWAMHVTPVHTVCRVVVTNKSVMLTPIDYDWIEKAEKSKALTVPFIKRHEPDSLLFTASSKQWMKFLREHRNSKDLFSETYVVRFMRQEKETDHESVLSRIEDEFQRRGSIEDRGWRIARPWQIPSRRAAASGGNTDTFMPSEPRRRRDTHTRETPRLAADSHPLVMERS